MPGAAKGLLIQSLLSCSGDIGREGSLVAPSFDFPLNQSIDVQPVALPSVDSLRRVGVSHRLHRDICSRRPRGSGVKYRQLRPRGRHD